MELSEAKILLDNLLARVKTQEDGSKTLEGVLTEKELEALQLALLHIDGPVRSDVPTVPIAVPVTTRPMPPIPDFVPANLDSPSEPMAESELPTPAPASDIELDLRALSADAPPANVRLCLDFGTAMSKATLVADDEDGDLEEIEVLHLGVPGDQEEVSETMLISSVYIDNAGLLWFGKAAVDRSMVEGADGSRQRLDNIKRRLSEDGWEEEVGERFNPTGLPITQGDMVLAYLMYLTWAVNGCLETLSYPWNLPRRFAMPCLDGEQGREAVHRLTKAVGEAQVLADTFYRTLKDGVPLTEFLAAVELLRTEPRNYAFVAESITEPLGVAGAMISWQELFNQFLMVVDVGAGTSDFSLFRININPAKGQNVAVEVKDTSRGVQQAGNHLDRMLIELIIKKSGITSEDPMWLNARGALELEIRNIKETLFNDGSVYVALINGAEVEVELKEFLELDAVCRFEAQLKKTMQEILESIDHSWIGRMKNHNQPLLVALTGGGAELPMVKSLAENAIRINNELVQVTRAERFPDWLRDVDEDLEADYPRIAVSLGGARKQLVKSGGTATVTAGDVTGTPTLGGYYVKGN